ncbi:zinc-binding dehydrogenase [Methylocapsa sp. S129]|uniref:zinc-binding dehydrogenase n=1 Tax=Methylocapsa sp. S129 TaxID=1641869 RepID=UPI00131EAF44|nr:zinc-binding dehydrogenase [Methylocapsa sp. S129]
MDVKTAKAAILVESRKPLVVDEIALPDALSFLQVLVKVHTSSICGAQINEIDAVKGTDKFLPHLLGHEALATVIDTGPGVTSCKRDDLVIMHWRPGKGMQSTPPAYSWNGRKVNAGWVTTFNEYAVVSENRVTPVPASIDKRSAPLLGCAVTTALGVINNDAQVGVGESVVVFGVGGVGLNVVQFAAMVGAYPIIAVDRLDNKLAMAQRFGATHIINSEMEADVAGKIRALVGADGVDKVIETTGVKGPIELGYDLTAKKGRCILVGVPREKVEIYTLPLHFDKVLKGSEGGQCQPARDIPRLVRLAEAGKINYDGIITDEFPLEKINDALELMRSGKSGRILLNIS